MLNNFLLKLPQDFDFGTGEDVTDASLDSDQLCSLQHDSGSSSLSGSNITSNGQHKQGQTSDKRNNENNQNNINTVLRRTSKYFVVALLRP